ncbi:TetR/AcrR family transcriptional regulator [Gordoniibacillus kamchatkensis]|uniref:TetR/AcrR family transcriptional regulator n=1 Tax=Gordoniibacillus kamchatkensis TaxID=1590651 RepID=UPI001E61EC0B|nr:TetR/AcrR family transcriptional regulator [Paenibacillus sp. VKM B-2647]
MTEAYKEERRAAILEGALYIFAEKGYAATTIDDIVRHLGISKGAIYNYFTSKDDIYTQIMDSRMNRFAQSLRGSFGPETSAAEKLRYLIRRLTDQPLGDLRRLLSFHIEYSLRASRQEELKAAIQKHAESALAFMTELIAEGKRNGEFRADADERVAASMFWALRDGIALDLLSHGEQDEYKGLMNGMEDMLFRYLRQ